jgi:hypothetical protein
VQVGTGTRGVALVENQVEHVQDHAQAILPLRVRRHPKWNAGILDLPLCPADALGHSRLWDEEGAGNLGGSQSTDRAQSEREL